LALAEALARTPRGLFATVQMELIRCSAQSPPTAVVAVAA